MVTEWVRSRASGFIHLEPKGTVSIPGAGAANQAVLPSGAGKLVAVGKRWVTSAEDCEVSVAIRWLAERTLSLVGFPLSQAA